MTDKVQIDEAGLRHLIDTFYARVRQDDIIGPLFNDAVHDWPDHLERLSAFWSSIMLGSGRYKGQPVPAHMQHKDKIAPEMFDRWLRLWQITTDELMQPEHAAQLQAKAARIAESLGLALFFKPAEFAHTRRASNAPKPEKAK